MLGDFVKTRPPADAFLQLSLYCRAGIGYESGKFLNLVYEPPYRGPMAVVHRIMRVYESRIRYDVSISNGPGSSVLVGGKECSIGCSQTM